MTLNAHTSKQKILSRVSTNLAYFLEKMREMGQRRNIPNISWNTADFFLQKLQGRSISNILEIGPANGFSTMMLALACPDAHITSIECSRHAFEELRFNISLFENLKNAPLIKGGRGDFFLNPAQSPGIACHPLYQGGKLPPFFSPADFPPKVTSEINQEKIGQFSLYYGDAREILPAFIHGAQKILCSNPASTLRDVPEQKFDCIFIDGAFRMTQEFFDLSQPLLSANGIIIIDDAIKYRWKMEGFHEYLEGQGIAYELVQTDEDDGIMVIK